MYICFCFAMFSHICAKLVVKALQEDFVNRPFFDEIIDYRTKTNQIWWRGYSTYDDSYRFNVTNLFEALILFDGDERFDDHVNCWADIFGISRNNILSDFKSLKELKGKF